jgi:hypothetical protein
MALTYGDTFILRNDANSLIYVRSYLGKNVVTVLYKPNSKFEPYTLPSDFQISQPKTLQGDQFKMDQGTISHVGESDEWQVEVFY